MNKHPIWFNYGSNLRSFQFIKFLYYYYILGIKHAQYGGCKDHPKQILYNGVCYQCYYGRSKNTYDN